MENKELLEMVRSKAQSWLSESYDAETRAQVQALLDNEDPTELIECFYKDLEFGTGGLRGIMGVGSNRMNIYTVGAATQGLSNYLNKNFKDLEHKYFENIDMFVCDVSFISLKKIVQKIYDENVKTEMKITVSASGLSCFKSS